MSFDQCSPKNIVRNRFFRLLTYAAITELWTHAQLTAVVNTVLKRSDYLYSVVVLHHNMLFPEADTDR